MYYSKSTNGFYSTQIHGSNMPADVVKITKAEHTALLAAQSQGKLITSDASGRPIAIDPPPAGVAEMWERIKSKRSAVEQGGVKVGTKWYHSDADSRIKYLGLVRMAEQALTSGASPTTVLQYGGVNIQWKTMDGSSINMNVQKAQDVYAAVIGLDFVAFATAESHRVAMETNPDPSLYDFSQGWPVSFGG